MPSLRRGGNIGTIYGPATDKSWNFLRKRRSGNEEDNFSKNSGNSVGLILEFTVNQTARYQFSKSSPARPGSSALTFQTIILIIIEKTSTQADDLQ